MMNKTLKILFAASLFILSACNTQKDLSETNLDEKVALEKEINRDVSFEMEVLSNTPEEVKIQVNLLNPSKQKLESIRSWVSYPTDILEGKSIEFVGKDSLGLIAPGEDSFDQVNGLAKIGVSLNPEMEAQEMMPIAILTFAKLEDKTAALSFYDQRDEGHTQVLVKREGKLRNVSSANQEPLIIRAENK